MKKFENYCSNLAVLLGAEKEDLSNDFIVSGIIDKFYIQFELGWKVLKELLKYEGRAEAKSGSPREILKAAYAAYGFLDETVWLAMLNERNSTAHLYDGEAALVLVRHVLDSYIPAFATLREEIEARYGELLDSL